MSQQSANFFEGFLRSSDLGWMIDLYAPKADAIPFLLQQLQGVTAEYLRRTGESLTFSPEALAEEAKKNPHKVRAFLQTLTATRSLEMLVMVWRIFQGLSIRHVELKYEELSDFSLDVVLARPGDSQEHLEKYHSKNIFDMRLVRNFGIGTVDEKPLFAGFSPQKKL